ncbi:RING-H2 finger protein [Melia azedarach]|uniref:RING-H2 finger protein n=1 Tax=Melia azedarach TaxID=155640 RepID=A0ACC1X110_MELAZ|nr:RING-H2 finger protein [Melia azedarach]
MAGIASTTLALVAYHFIVIKYCMRRRLQRFTTSEFQKFTIGIDEKTLRTIPIFCYSRKDDCKLFRVDQIECVICLGELADGEMVRLLPICRHSFHVSCIDNWFAGHSNCPLCRSPVVETTRSISQQVALPLPSHDDDRNNDETQLDTSASDGSASSSSGFLRRSLSMVLPMEVKQQLVEAASLRRSLSVDQLREDDEESCCSSSGRVLRESRSYTTRSVRQLYRMSARLVRSCSQLKMMSRSRSSNATAAGNVLPY